MNETATAPYITEVSRHSVALPDAPHALWERGELHDLLLLPDDGSRVEIIGGEIVVSPAPHYRHGVIIQTIQDAFRDAFRGDANFTWRTIQCSGLTMVGIGDGYVPDLLVMAEDVFLATNDSGARNLMPDEIEMAVEVTSPSNPAFDRPPPSPTQHAKSKWSGYARAEIPYYLLVDRCPKRAKATLYSIPDRSAGAYLHQESWEFGETITLPEPFGVEITTPLWRSWDGEDPR